MTFIVMERIPVLFPGHGNIANDILEFQILMNKKYNMRNTNT